MNETFFEQLFKLFKENDLEIEVVDPCFSLEEIDHYHVEGNRAPQYICDAKFNITIRGRCRSEEMIDAAKRFETWLNNTLR